MKQYIVYFLDGQFPGSCSWAIATVSARNATDARRRFSDHLRSKALPPGEYDPKGPTFALSVNGIGLFTVASVNRLGTAASNKKIEKIFRALRSRRR